MGFITGHKLKATTHLKPALNTNKNLCHEKISTAEKSILSTTKAKASTVYYTFTLASCVYTSNCFSFLWSSSDLKEELYAQLLVPFFQTDPLVYWKV